MFYFPTDMMRCSIVPHGKIFVPMPCSMEEIAELAHLLPEDGGEFSMDLMVFL